MPVFGDKQRCHEHRDEHLDHEHDRGHLGRRAPLQRAHLGQQANPGCKRGGHSPREGAAEVPGPEGIGHELGGQTTPRQRGPRADRHQRPGASPREGSQGYERDASQGDRKGGGARVMGGWLRGHCGQQTDAAEDAEHCERLACSDALAEAPPADDQKQDEAECERRLHDGQRGKQQRDRLKRPAEDVERGSCEPAAPARQPHQQRGPQRMRGRGHARVEGLQREADVVQRGCGTGCSCPEEDW